MPSLWAHKRKSTQKTNFWFLSAKLYKKIRLLKLLETEVRKGNDLVSKEECVVSLR